MGYLSAFMPLPQFSVQFLATPLNRGEPAWMVIAGERLRVPRLTFLTEASELAGSLQPDQRPYSIRKTLLANLPAIGVVDTLKLFPPLREAFITRIVRVKCVVGGF